MKKPLFLFILLLGSRGIYAHHTVNLDSILELANRLWEQKKYDSVIYVSQSGAHLSWSNSNTYAEAVFTALQGKSEMERSRFKKAILLLSKTLELAQKTDDTLLIARTLLNLGITHKKQGNYNLACLYLLDASEKLEQVQQYDSSNTELEDDLASTYNTLGAAYFELKENKLAIGYYQTALRLRLKTHNERGISGSYNYISNFYKDIGNYYTALYYQNLSLIIKKRLKDERLIGSGLINMAAILHKAGLREQAIEKLEEARSCLQNSHDLEQYSKLYHEWASIYLEQKKYLEARATIHTALLAAHSANLRTELLQLYKLNYAICEEYGDAPQALHYSRMYIQLQDSLLKEQNDLEITGVTLEYERNNEKRMADSRAERSRKREEKNLIITLIISLVALIIFLLYLSNRKKKIKIEILLKELNHRVKNNLQLLYSVFSLQEARIEEESTRKLVRENLERINAMMLVHKKLYQNDGSFTHVDMKEYTENLIKDLQYSYNYTEKNIRLNLDIQEVWLEADKAVSLGLIINELLSNSFKHAFHGHDNPELKVQLICKENKQIQLCIADNGKGFTPEEAGKKTSFGMKLVQLLSKQLKGKLETTHESGCSTVLSFENK